MTMAQDFPPIHKVWNYNKPVVTREKFLELAEAAKQVGNKAYYLEAMTQVARTYSLVGEFVSAEKYLNLVETENEPPLLLPSIRYNLEKGS